MNKLYLYVTGDTNDADYVSKLTEISKEDLEKFKPLIEAIGNFQPYDVKSFGGWSWSQDHNWPSGEDFPRTDLGEKYIHEIYDQFDEELIDQFEQEYVPYNIHSIVFIKLLEVSSIKELIKNGKNT